MVVTEIAPGLASTAGARSGPGSVSTAEDGIARIAVFASKSAAAHIAAGPSNPTTQFEVSSITRDTTLTVRADGLTRARVSGVVRTAGGAVLPGVRVTLDGPESVSLTTDFAGAYQAALTPGVYRFHLASSGAHLPGLPATWSLPLDAASIQADRSIDFALPAVKRLRVQVIGVDDEPLVGAVITGLELPTVRTELVPGIFTTASARSGSPTVSTGADGYAMVPVFPSLAGSGVLEPGPNNPLVRFDVRPVSADTPETSVTVKVADHVDDVSPHIVCAARDLSWHADNVTLACTSVDLGSGLAEVADAAFTLHTSVPAGTETDRATTDSRSVCDRALDEPNCVSAGPFSAIKIDRRAPDPGCDQPALGWFAANASVVCSPRDGGSGLASGGPFVLRTAVEAGVETTAATTDSREVCDAVGNCSGAGPFTGLRIDQRPPSVGCARADSAPRTTNATVACTATDGGSGLASGEDSAFVLRTNVAPGRHDAAAMTAAREVCDAAHNCATVAPVGPFDIDLTTVVTPPDPKPPAFCPDRAVDCIPRLPTASERDRRATAAIARRVVAAACRPDGGESALGSIGRARLRVGGSEALRAASRRLCSSGLTVLVALGDGDPVPDERTSTVHVVPAAHAQVQSIRLARTRCRGNDACRAAVEAAADLAAAADSLESAALELHVARNRLATAIVKRSSRDKSLQSAVLALLEVDIARAQTAAFTAERALARAITGAGASTTLPASVLRATTDALRAGRGIPTSIAKRLTDTGLTSAGLAATLHDLPTSTARSSLGGIFKGAGGSSRIAIGRTLTLGGLKAIVVNLASTAVIPPATTRKLLNHLLRASSACPAGARRAAITRFGNDASRITRTRMLANAAGVVVLPTARCPRRGAG